MNLSEGSFLIISLKGRLKEAQSLDAFLTISRMIIEKFDAQYVEDQKVFLGFMVKVRWSMNLGELYDFSDRIRTLRGVIMRYFDAYEANYNTRFIQTGG